MLAGKTGERRMKRREFAKLVAATVAWPITASAQKPMPVIGILAVAAPDNAGAQRNLAAFRQGLAESGYVEGRNVAIEYRGASADYDRLPGLAAELVARNVDVIVTEGGEGAVFAAKQATSIIPIVCFVGIDPVKHGLVASIARRGAT
jgi:putative ABC transport system substrate-binding protein